MKLKMRLEYSDKTSLLEVKLFFQMPLETFLCTFIQCSRYLEVPPNIALCVSKTNRDHTTHQADYMSRKVTKI